MTLPQRSANAIETDTVRENWSGANGYNMSQQTNRFYVSRYAITRADVERLAAADPTATVLTDRAIGRFGERQCKLSLYPLEFRYLLDAIVGEERRSGA